MAKKRDWAAYNAALERRGSLTIFVDDDVIDAWMNVERPGRPGAPYTYSEAAYRACYSFQLLYNLPLRQTRGFMNSLLRLMGTALSAPSPASLCEQRQRHVLEPFVAPATGPLTLILDATGFKTTGAGEWLNHKWHAGQANGEPRRWRKLHIGVDHATGQIVSFAATNSSVGDITAAPALIHDAAKQREVAEVLADGAYDSRKMYELICDELGAKATIRLPWTAARGLHPQRDEAFRIVNWLGQDEWRRRTAYGRRSYVETTMSRLKRLKPRLAARSAAGQVAELSTLIGVANRLAYDTTGP
jgi:transposase